MEETAQSKGPEGTRPGEERGRRGHLYSRPETFRASHSPFSEESSLDAHSLRSFEALLRCPFV